MDRRRRLVDDVFEDGVGGVELRYPGCELYHIIYISIIRRWMEEDMSKTYLRRTGTRIRNKTAIGAYRLTGYFPSKVDLSSREGEGDRAVMRDSGVGVIVWGGGVDEGCRVGVVLC